MKVQTACLQRLFNTAGKNISHGFPTVAEYSSTRKNNECSGNRKEVMLIVYLS